MEKGIFETCFTSMIYDLKEAHYQKSISQDAEYLQFRGKADEAEENLKASLTPEQIALLNEMVDAEGDAARVYEEYIYKAGLQDGAQLSKFLFEFKACSL